MVGRGVLVRSKAGVVGVGNAFGCCGLHHAERDGYWAAAQRREGDLRSR